MHYCYAPTAAYQKIFPEKPVQLEERVCFQLIMHEAIFPCLQLRFVSQGQNDDSLVSMLEGLSTSVLLRGMEQ